ncbi:MAG: hypothetical protein AAF551_13675 [Bacteroidota bacterium]
MKSTFYSGLMVFFLCFSCSEKNEVTIVDSLQQETTTPMPSVNPLSSDESRKHDFSSKSRRASSSGDQWNNEIASESSFVKS